MQSIKTNSYIYRHLKPNGEVFYIGIGTDKTFNRAHSSKGRNRFWHFIVEKYGYEIQILKKNITREEAIELEMTLISWYGRRDNKTGILCNLTDGGEGNVGLVRSEESKDKIRGENNYLYGKTHTQELKDLMSQNRKGKGGIKGELHYAYGKPRPQELREEHSKRMSGAKHPRAKKVLDTETGTIYNCVGEAAEAYNIPKTTLTGWLNGLVKNKSNLIYV